jgi:uncharacterized protein YjiS (DUF1127 family)
MTSHEAMLRQLPTQPRTTSGLLTSLLTAMDAWIERHRQRNALLELNDAMLKDIGISRADAEHEGTKPFWTR